MLRPLQTNEGRRTEVVNRSRAFLWERGITFRRGRDYLQARLLLILEDAELNLSSLLRQLLDQLWQDRRFGRVPRFTCRRPRGT